MLMRHELHGWHNAYGAEIEECKKNGWVESSEEEHKNIVAKKNIDTNIQPKSGIESIETKKRGRPFKV